MKKLIILQLLFSPVYGISALCASMPPDAALAVSTTCNIIYEGATVVEGVMEIAEPYDPSKITTAIKIGVQITKIGLAMAKETASRCYAAALHGDEEKFHKAYVQKMQDLNNEMDKRTRQMQGKFTEMEHLIGNVTHTVAQAVDSIKTVKIREAKEVFKEVILDFNALMMEFKLNKADSALTLFYGLCNTARMKDPESVIRRLLSILKMENNPFLIISESARWTDTSVHKYIITTTLACGHLARAADVCLQHRSAGRLARWTMDSHIRRRNEIVNQLAEALNSLNSKRESAYYNKDIIGPLIFPYVNASRGYNSQISEAYTLFYMDTEEFLLRRKYIYSLEFNGEGPITKKGNIKDPAWLIGYNGNYIKILSWDISKIPRRIVFRNKVYLIRTEISDPDIWIPKQFRTGINEIIKTTQNRRAMISAILEKYGCGKIGSAEVFVISVYVVDIPPAATIEFEQPYYGFGKCYSEKTQSAGGSPAQVVYCFLMLEECTSSSPTFLDISKD